MELICPNCSAIIDADNINVMTDLAKCVRCNTLHKASALVAYGVEKTSEHPPKGSMIKLSRESGDMVNIHMPAKGFKPSMIPQLLFTVFWLGFITFWTTLASQAGFFALFSIPFWIAGFFMLGAIIIGVAEKQTIKVGRGKIAITKSRPFFPKKLEYNFSEIEEIALKSNQGMATFSTQSFRLQNRYGPPPELPSLISGSGTKTFFESANDAEKAWVVKYLNYKLAEAKR